MRYILRTLKLQNQRDLQTTWWNEWRLHPAEYGKFRGSRAIVGLVPSCHCAFVGFSWAWMFFSWVFRDFKIFSRRYFVGSKFFLVSISWFQSFLSWVFRGSKIFTRGYFVGLKFSPQNFQNFVIFSCCRMKKSSIEIYLKLCNFFQIEFNNCKFSPSLFV